MTHDELLGIRPSLDELLPVDAERREFNLLSEQKSEAFEEQNRLAIEVYKRSHQKWDWDRKILENEYWDALVRLEDLEARLKVADEALTRRVRLYMVVSIVTELIDECPKRGVHRQRATTIDPGDERSEVRFSVPGSGSLRIWYASWFSLWLLGLTFLRKRDGDRIRRSIQAAIEAARDRCRSAIARCVATIMLRALLGLFAALAAEVFERVRPELPPRVLSAGGCSGFFALTC